MANYTIPFNKPSLVGRELDYVACAIRNGHSAGDGAFTHRCQELFESDLGVRKAILTTSCTHALEMSAILLDLSPGDEVIVPSFTFVSTANAFALRGATPVFADIRPDTLNLDEERLETLITRRTKAVVVVHYAGVGCEMDRISEIAKHRGIAVIEDNAHGLFARYKGCFLGTFGSLSTQSFHETKNIICGEGGALFINNEAMVARAEVLRDKGTNRQQFVEGVVDKYTWVDVGSSFAMSDVLAAFLFGQLEKRNEIQIRRRTLWDSYHEALAQWARNHGVRQPVVPPHCEQSHHMYYLLMPSPEARRKLIHWLGELGILAVFHYSPLHSSAMGLKFGGCPGQCPVAEHVSQRLLRLPFYTAMTPAEQMRVIDAVLSFGW